MTVRFRSYTKKDGSPEYGVYAVLEYLNGLTEKDIVVRIDYDKKSVFSLNEVDFFFPTLKISHLKLKNIDDHGTFEATFDTKDLRSVFALLAAIGGAANPGHSYEMCIGKKRFSIDGDGADYIESINGVKLTGKLVDDRNKWPDVYNKGTETEYVTISEAQLRKIISESIKATLLSIK